MRSRRSFLAASTVASAGFLSGCVGLLGESDDGATGPDDLSPMEEPTAILTLDLNTDDIMDWKYDLKLSGDPRQGDRVEVHVDGEVVHTIESEVDGVTVAEDVGGADSAKAIGVYENGEEETLSEPCIECVEGSDDDNSDLPDSIDPDSDSSDVDFGDSGDTSEPDIGDSDGSTDPISTREEVMDTRTTISEDGYHYWGYELNRQAELSFSYTVRSGPEIDVFVVSESELSEYEDNNRFRSYLSSDGISGSESGVLSSGRYYIIVDNTNAGSVSPPTNLNDDEVDVEIEAHVEG